MGVPNPQRLEELLRAEQKAGFFTDFYVEAGRLDQTQAAYFFGNDQLFFDLASLTKALATGPLVHDFLSRCSLDLSTPLSDWPDGRWQAAFCPALMAKSAHDFLSHRSGLPAWRNFWLGHLNEGKAPSPQRKNQIIVDSFARLPAPGGAADVYSDLGYILLGYALEAASGQSLDALWATHIASLGLAARDIGYAHQLARAATDFVPSAFCAIRQRLLQGEVHDENAAALGGVAGHAGLFSSGPKLGEYLRQLFQSNEGGSYLHANAADLMTHPFEGLSGLRRGSGSSAALFAKGQGMGHLGFVGTAFWLDLPSRRYAIFLSNRVISGRLNPRMSALRRQVFGDLYELT